MSKHQALFLVLVVVGTLSWLLFHPVCTHIPNEDLINFSPPITERTNERGMIWKYWEEKNGEWFQCKSAIERFGFY